MKTLIGFIIGAIVCTPFGFCLGAMINLGKKEDTKHEEWIEKQYFDLRCDGEGFEVITH